MSEPSSVGSQPAGYVTGEITTRFPAQPEFVLLARTCTSVVSSILEFGLDKVEDLRLAVDELCTLCLVDAVALSQVELVYTWDSEALVISCTLSPARTQVPKGQDSDPVQQAMRELGLQIIDGLVDEYEVGAIDGETERAWIRVDRLKSSGDQG